jgi:hypothetical protein
MDEERQRRIFGILEDLLSEHLKADRKLILDAVTDLIVQEHQSAGGDLCEEIRQCRLELGQLNAMLDEVRRDLRQVQQAGSLPATPAGKHELN